MRAFGADPLIGGTSFQWMYNMNTNL